MTLEVKNISFRYGERKILENFSMTVRPEQRIGIVAPSGRGKTTLCKILAGYLRPEQGDVLLDGRPVTSSSDYCPVQMIWQTPELAVDPRMRMRAVLEESGPIEEYIVKKAGIHPEWMERFPTELSGGELQRFCIARALGKGTRYLIADEITTMLDMITQSQIWHFLLEETRKRKIGLICVSHDRKLLDRLCTDQIDL